MGARALPFDLPDFEAPAPSTPAEPTFTRIALDEARADGVAEGRRLAMATIAADEAAALARIADNLERAQSQLEEARAKDRAEVAAAAAEFLEDFAGGLAEVRELEAALDLLRRLTAHSDDRRAARIVLARASEARLAPKIGAALQARRLADFVSIDSDPALKPGEMRIEWRGGEARRTRQEISAAAAAFTRSLGALKEQKP